MGTPLSWDYETRQHDPEQAGDEARCQCHPDVRGVEAVAETRGLRYPDLVQTLEWSTALFERVTGITAQFDDNEP